MGAAIKARIRQRSEERKRGSDPIAPFFDLKSIGGADREISVPTSSEYEESFFRRPFVSHLANPSALFTPSLKFAPKYRS